MQQSCVWQLTLGEHQVVRLDECIERVLGEVVDIRRGRQGSQAQQSNGGVLHLHHCECSMCVYPSVGESGIVEVEEEEEGEEEKKKKKDKK